MKVFCVTGNYNNPDKYGEDSVDTESKALEWYLVPDSAIIRTDNPFFIPDFDREFTAYPTLAVKIERLGKGVGVKFANRYYSEVAPAVAVQATRLLESLKKEGKPWDRAVVFDKCCFLGNFLQYTDFERISRINFQIGETEINWDLRALNRGIDDIISELSRENTIKTGDIMLIGLGNTGIKLRSGECLNAIIDNENLLSIRIK